MKFSQLPRRKKQLIFALSFLAISFAAGLVDNVKGVNADTNSSTVLDTSAQYKSIDVLFKVVDASGQPVAAYVDATVAKSDCTTDIDQSLGFTGETLTDGTAVLSLPADRVFSIQATPKEGTAQPATVAVAIGTASHNGCAQDVKAANSEAIAIPIK